MSKKSITFCDVNGQTHDFPIETPDYGTCATAGDVAEKVVVSESFSLYTGAKVTVKFANANTAGTITLNVNGTGANTVYFPGDGTYTTDAGEIIQAGGCYDFVYDDGWRFVGAAGGGSGTVENVDIDVENNRLLVGDGANGFYDQYEPTKNIVVVGNNATASAVSVTIGNNAGSSGTNGVAIGNNSKNNGADNIAIGCDATTTGVGSVAVGSSASVTQQGGVAVGAGAQATASGAIQIGEGTNSTASTFQVGEYTLLDASGKIPAERLNSGGGSGQKKDSIVIGTTTSGHTADDCDFLCNGDNDTTVVQSAVADAVTKKMRKMIFLKGSYTISDTIEIGDYPSLIDGNESNINFTGEDTCFQIDDPACIEIRKVYFIGATNSYSLIHLAAISNPANNMIVENCSFYARGGRALDISDAQGKVIIRNCDFSGGCDESIYASGCYIVEIENNNFASTGVVDILPDRAYTGSTVVKFNNNHITGYAASKETYAMRVKDDYSSASFADIYVCGNTIESVGGISDLHSGEERFIGAIDLECVLGKYHIIGNTFYCCGEFGTTVMPVVDNSTETIFSNNIFSDCAFVAEFSTSTMNGNSMVLGNVDTANTVTDTDTQYGKHFGNSWNT